MYSAAVLTLLVAGATLTAAENEVCSMALWDLHSLFNHVFYCACMQMRENPIGSATFNSSDITFTIGGTCRWIKPDNGPLGESEQSDRFFLLLFSTLFFLCQSFIAVSNWAESEWK
jgi:nicotinamide riboside kinase